MSSWWTRMVLLTVFCVILYLHTGVSNPMPNQNYDQDVYVQRPKYVNYQTNHKDSLHTLKNESNANQNWVRQVGLPSSILRKSKDLLHRPEDVTGPQLLTKTIDFGHRTPSVQKPVEKVFYPTLQRNPESGYNINLQNVGTSDRLHVYSSESSTAGTHSGLVQPLNGIYDKQFGLPVQKPFEFSKVSLTNSEQRATNINQDRNTLLRPEASIVTSPSSYQNVNNVWKTAKIRNEPRKELDLPLSPKQNTRLDLQGVSLEYIKSLSTLPIKNPPAKKLYSLPSAINYYSNEGKSEDSKYLDSNFNSEISQSFRASAQNPSAEILYKTNQALPYKISDHQFEESFKDNSNLRRILNSAQSLKDIYRSGKPLKRYTVMHPDGSVEHTDNIEKVVAKYPNYITIQLSDLRKYAETSKSVLPSSVAQWHMKDKTVPLNRKSESSPVKQEVNKEIYPGSSKTEQFDVDLTKSNVASELSTSFLEKLNKSDLSQPIVGQTPLKNANISQEEHPLNNQITGNVYPTLTKLNTVLENNNDINSFAKKSVNLSTEALQNYSKENSLIADMPNNTTLAAEIQTLQDKHDKSSMRLDNSTIMTDSTQTDLINNEHNNCNSSFSTNAAAESRYIDGAANTTSNSTTFVNEDVSVTYPTSTPLSSVESQDQPGIWFPRDSENVWYPLINDTQNLFYFMFVPPIANLEKESSKTIYPNGTTVEEKIETIRREGGVSTVTKTTTITHTCNTTDIDVETCESE